MVLLNNTHVLRCNAKFQNRFFGAQIVYKIVLAFAKASICHTYYRIFYVSSIKFRMACHTTQFVIVSSAIAFIIGTIFQCRPVRAFWNQSIADASCIDQTPWWMSFAIVQITTDVVILILPATQVFKLQISRTKRIGILLAFCTGLFVTFTSIFRATTLAASATSSDPTCKIALYHWEAASVTRLTPHRGSYPSDNMVGHRGQQCYHRSLPPVIASPFRFSLQPLQRLGPNAPRSKYKYWSFKSFDGCQNGSVSKLAAEQQRCRGRALQR